MNGIAAEVSLAEAPFIFMRREAAVEDPSDWLCERIEINETWRPLAPQSSQVVGIGDEMTS